MENNNAVLIYTAEEENFDYSKATYERDGWGGGEYPLESNPRQYALMDSDRVYTDDNNIQR